MAKVRRDEILAPVGNDVEIIPRYDIVDNMGNVLQDNVKLVLKNEIMQPGMTVDKAAMDECLAASGVTHGTKKNLQLTQDNFVLFNGALVRFQLFDIMTGATTLNVNNTGARRLKTIEGEDPDGFLRGSWVDAIYSEDKDVFIIVGGGTGGVATTQNINLLEEVSQMKYCKILTRDESHYDTISNWLKHAVLTSMCETDNYMVYARERQNSSYVELMYVHKKTSEVHYKRYGIHTYCNMSSINSDYAAGSGIRAKLQIIPIRNSDHIIVGTFAQWQYTQSYYYYFAFYVGILLFNGTQINIINNTGSQSSSNNQYNLNQAATHALGLMNGLYDADNDRIYVATTQGPRHTNADATWGSVSCLYCYNATTGQRIWQYAQTPANWCYYLGGFNFYIIDNTKAIAFQSTGADSNGNPSDGGSRYPIGILSFTPTATSVGSLSFKGTTTSYICPSQTGVCAGWKINEEEEEYSIMYTAPRNVGNTESSGIYVNCITYHNKDDSVTTKSYLVEPNSSNYMSVSFLPGYVKEPICYVLSNYRYLNSPADDGFYYNLETKEKLRCTAISSCYVNHKSRTITQTSGSNTTYNYYQDWIPFNSAAKAGGYAAGDILYGISKNGNLFQQDLTNLTEKAIEWVCPEDGVYKFIAVGGGAAGGSYWGGGAGYLNIATKYLTEGQTLLIDVGYHGMFITAASTMIVSTLGTALPTRVTIKDTGEEIIFAPEAHLDKGGASGAPTTSGGGAGGYNLVTYGGQGMPYTTSDSYIPQKDGNGGTSANAGAVTPGDGYGAGGGMNQPGKDGCLVIIR